MCRMPKGFWITAWACVIACTTISDHEPVADGVAGTSMSSDSMSAVPSLSETPTLLSGNGAAATGGIIASTSGSGSPDPAGGAAAPSSSGAADSSGAGGASGNGAGLAASGAAAPPACGDGKVDPGETCDPKSDCPTLETCRTEDPCLAPALVGSVDTCDAKCDQKEITECKVSDKCCPKGCNNSTDSDCSVSCGDGVATGGETCEVGDPQKPCPASCDDNDPCTKDMQTGTPAQCNVVCTHMPITRPQNADQCCPPSANAGNDSDCNTRCGDGAVTGSETCDPMSSTPCPIESSCRSDGCNGATYSGNASNCTAKCTRMTITERRGGDDCCPSGANVGNDSDCEPRCGDGVKSAGETCDPVSSCPTSSSCRSSGCSGKTFSGSASNCSARCDSFTITTRISGDGCCPSGANKGSDSDCKPMCGDSIVSPEAGETCDTGTGSAVPCPTRASCVAGNCETATFTGDPARCTSSCNIRTNDTNRCGGCSTPPGTIGDVCYPNPSNPDCMGTYQCLDLDVVCLAVC